MLFLKGFREGFTVAGDENATRARSRYDFVGPGRPHFLTFAR